MQQAIKTSSKVDVNSHDSRDIQSKDQQKYYRYQWWEMLFLLLGVIGTCLISVSTNVFAFWSGTSSALVLIPFVYALVRDTRGVTSMRGRILWNTLTRKTRKWLTFGLIFLFPITFIVYTFCALLDTFPEKKEKVAVALLQKQHLAALEAQLGIQPIADGVCRSCQKPLQLGAEFCAFCGDSVVLKLPICPHCATTTFPEAKFCPVCAAVLQE